MYTVNKYANTSKVEEYLNSLFYGTLSEHVFVGTLPSTTDLEWDEMVLIDCDLPMVDNGVYTRATVYVFLYARPNTDGTKNVHKLAQMEETLGEILDNAKDDHYSINRQSNGSDYDSQLNWHRDFVYLNIVINKY